MATTLRALRALAPLVLLPLAAARHAPAALQIKLFTFAPKSVTVAVGDTLVVTNADDAEHTVTFGTPERKDTRLTGVVLGKGGSATVVARAPGTYAFYCERHPFMMGTLTVTKP